MQEISKKSNFLLIENILFITLIIISLIPIWQSKYFLTQDGPSHLYNSKVLLDYITSNNVNLYNQYYYLNPNLEPNWFGHLALAILLLLLPPFLAEKVFLSLYVVLFPILLRSLLRVINKNSIFLSFLCFPFLYHFTFQLGFYNFSFSILFFLLGVRYWMKHQFAFSCKKLLIFALLLLLLYFTHPVGYIYFLVAIVLLLITAFLIKLSNHWKQLLPILREYSDRSLIVLIALLPSLVLLLEYFYRKGLHPTFNPHTLNGLYHDFLALTSLVLLTGKEVPWAIATSGLFGLIFIYAVIQKIRLKSFSESDAFFLLFLMALSIYFRQPTTIAGGIVFSFRLQFLPYLMLIPWFSTLNFNDWLKKFIVTSVCVIFTTLIMLRIPEYQKAGKAVEEYVSVAPYIEDRSTVLPLSFCHFGKTAQGEIIANKIALFLHAADYIGTQKSLILLGNYEGDTDIFPIIWRWGKNPFVHISTNEGIENQPPSVDFATYSQRTGGTVDYVITWCLDNQYLDHPYTQSILEQLRRNYTLIYSSENNLAKLYKKNNPQ
jgi:hypothetical protein